MNNILCFGDSITFSKAAPEGRRWTAIVQSTLDQVAPGQYDVYNRGIGGNTTFDGLHRFDVDIQPLLPATVLLEFGFNDAVLLPGRLKERNSPVVFRENLTEIIALVRKGGGRPVLLTNHPIAKAFQATTHDAASYKANAPFYNQMIRDMATAHTVPLIDLETTMTQAAVAEEDLLSEDGLHLSVKGNATYARFVLSGLKPLLGLC